MRYNDSEEEEEADAGKLLSEHTGVDASKGTVELFGKQLHVGSGLAYVIDFFYEPFVLKISESGGNFFHKIGQQTAKNVFRSSEVTAQKAGNATGAIWRYGSLVWDIGIGTSKTIRDGFRQMREVSDELKPYLAANHGFKVGVRSLMSDTNSGVMNVRLAVMKRSKYGLMRNFTSLIMRTPSLMLTMWKGKLTHYDQRREIYDSLSEEQQHLRAQEFSDIINPPPPANNSVLNKIEDIRNSEEYKRWQYRNHGKDFHDYLRTNPSTAFNFMGDLMNPSNLKGTFNQLFRPKTEAELRVNEGLFQNTPFISGLLKRFVGEKFNRGIDKNDVNEMTAILIARKARAIKEQPPEDRRELSDDISNLFKQYFKECGSHKDISQRDCSKLGKVCDELTNAILDEGLNPYALIDLICSNKLIKYTKHDLIFTSSHDRQTCIRKEAAKYSKIDNKDFEKDIGIHLEDIKKIYGALGPEERSFFVMLFPPGVLEQQGIDKHELTRLRKANRDEFIHTLSQTLLSLKDMSSADLKQKYGMPEDTAKSLLSFADDFSEASQYGEREGDGYLTKHQREVANTIIRAGARSGPKGKFWSEFVRKDRVEPGNNQESDPEAQEENLAARGPKKPLDHAQRKRDGDESITLSE